MRLTVAVVGLVVGTSAIAAADTYPSRPITIIAPTSAGGPPDTIARLLSDKMKAALGQPVVVENVTGAGGSLGVQRVVRSAPDGYTVSIGHLNSHVFTGAAYNLSFDLLADLVPVTLLTTAPMVFVARTNLPPNNVAELIAWTKAEANAATFGSVGVGGPGKVWSTDLGHKTGARFQYVPYRGASAIIQDIIAGQLDLSCVEGSNVLSHLRSGSTLKPYAVLSSQRWSAAPNVPTIDEAGAPGFYMSFWHGLWVPKDTPKDIVARLNAAAVEALADANVSARLAQVGQEIVPRDQQNPQALAARHKAEIEKWWPIIRAAGVKPE